ncbi:MAG: HDOD domain-containing protein [Myxococcota bacterium]
MNAKSPVSRASQLVKSAKELPPPSSMVGPLLRLMGDVRCDLRTIGKFVASDPILASDALRVANSAAYAASTGPVDDCVFAVVRLGESIICSLVAARMKGVLGKPSLHGYDMQESGLWKHSLRVAIASRLLAKRSGLATPAVAYTAGLLVDIGKILMAESVAERWDDLMALVGVGDDVPFDEAERQLFGIDHASLGAAATRAWNIPEPVPSAIGASHHPGTAPPEVRALASLVHIADALVTQIGVAAGADGLRYDLDEAALALLKIDRAGLESVVIETELEFRKTESVLSAAA